MTEAITLNGIGHAWLTGLVSGRCPTGKNRYATGEDARLALEFLALRARDSMRRRERTYYGCGHCGGYHTTSHVPAEPLRG